MTRVLREQATDEWLEFMSANDNRLGGVRQCANILAADVESWIKTVREALRRRDAGGTKE